MLQKRCAERLSVVLTILTLSGTFKVYIWCMLRQAGYFYLRELKFSRKYTRSRLPSRRNKHLLELFRFLATTAEKWVIWGPELRLPNWKRNDGSHVQGLMNDIISLKGGTIFREYSSILRHCETTVIFFCLSPVQRLYQVKTCFAMSNV